MPLLLIKDLRCFSLLMFAVAMATALPGCGGPGDAADYAEVSGKVTFKGQPLADANIVFVPASMSNNEEPSEGKTDAAGNYFMSRRRDNDGARIGKNHVVIEKRGPSKPLAPDKIADPADTHEPGDALIPSKYFSAASSGLQFDVKPGKNTDVNFDLTE